MNIKIDELGYLHIKRAGHWHVALCPFTKVQCTHNCVKFGEPDYTAEGISGYLQLCNGDSIYFKTLEDLRNA